MGVRVMAEWVTLSLLFHTCVVGEPLNDEAWKWYHRVVGEERCTVVDTWWQTGKNSNCMY